MDCICSWRRSRCNTLFSSSWFLSWVSPSYSHSTACRWVRSQYFIYALDPVPNYGVYNGVMKQKTISDPSAITIGQVAKLAQVGVETIRFYEREGIIAEPPRRESGYRIYDTAIVTRLRFIKRAQELGFSLKEISELLALRVKANQNCERVKKRAESKLSEIKQKISDLTRMQKILTEVTEACVASKPIADCPILKAFEKND
jgi:MerR family copper efflux transcriptional regulator